jgi:xanthine dehydrogenase YagR molybdenum-binding subunit
MSIIETVKGAAQAAMMTGMAKLVPLAPDRWIPGGIPDPLIRHKHGLIGTPVSRLDGPLKVQGAARFAAEVPLENMAYAALVYGTIPSGRIAMLRA